MYFPQSLSVYMLYVHIKIVARTCEAGRVSAREAVQRLFFEAQRRKKKSQVSTGDRCTDHSLSPPPRALLSKSPRPNSREREVENDAGLSCWLGLFDGAPVAFHATCARKNNHTRPPFFPPSLLTLLPVVSLPFGFINHPSPFPPPLSNLLPAVL